MHLLRLCNTVLGRAHGIDEVLSNRLVCSIKIYVNYVVSTTSLSSLNASYSWDSTLYLCHIHWKVITARIYNLQILISTLSWRPHLLIINRRTMCINWIRQADRLNGWLTTLILGVVFLLFLGHHVWLELLIIICGNMLPRINFICLINVSLAINAGWWDTSLALHWCYLSLISKILLLLLRLQRLLWAIMTVSLAIYDKGLIFLSNRFKVFHFLSIFLYNIWVLSITLNSTKGVGDLTHLLGRLVLLLSDIVLLTQSNY